ncbi:Rpn family recombination-promoting nuclease/putative transposase [Escherichia coli]|uniref:Rpn family recombination-promoting nuclease/putative transposase n=1 Tax=Escherichia coli TaxID=562 RepID=UPI00207B4B41|nr:Rpn family recombination-promoting nuclease/putative transposase [Escherichia coli]
MSEKNHTTPTPTPHDAAFMAMMENPSVARDFLEAELPPAQLQRCDMNTLKLEPATFVDPDLRQFASDVLWSMRTTDGHDGYIYALTEHQSSADRFMALRMMHYVLAIMYHHLKTHNQAPIVIPVFFYHGEPSPYPYSLNWLDSPDDPVFGRELYGEGKPPRVIDVGLLDDEGIRCYQQMAALMLLMKVRQRKGDLMTQLDFLSQLLQIQGTHDQVVVLLNYMVKACDSASPEFIRVMAEHLPRYEDDIMTIAERLRQEEREKALEKMLEAARRMLLDVN